MNDFQSLKKKYGVTPKPPLHLPFLVRPCDQCERNTETKILFMKAGLGNACANCGRLRRSTPYLSKTTFNALKLQIAKGDNNGPSTK